MNTFSLPSRSNSRTVLALAGHDPSSGAGITADLQTFAAHRLFGTSVITALTVQSTQGVAEVHPVDPNLLLRTVENLCADLPPSGIKIGMLGSPETATAIATFLTAHLHQKPSQKKGISAPVPVVFDPVLRSSSGADLLPPAGLEVLHQQLIPSVTWITPNWAELSALTDRPINDLAQAEAATHTLGLRHPHLYIVATAGDHRQPTDILRLPSGDTHRFMGEHIESTSTHGTGCAFSSALLSHLVMRDTPNEAVRGAKHFVAEAIRRAPGLGQGTGPLNLSWHIA